MKKYSLFAIAIVFITSCKKTNNSNAIVGEWSFRSQLFATTISGNSYSFINSSTTILSGTTENDSILSIQFNGNGTYTLSKPFGIGSGSYIPNIITPSPTIGNYRIFQDSLLIIQSDTSLLESTYNAIVPPPFPNGDTIYFKTISTDSLFFSQEWEVNNQIQPDSVITTYYACFSGFKRIK